ncbi:3'-5' exonuclease [Vibrio gazogenes]|uniref:DNA polymerase-3 subunit epsilon n=1 Tax=Vibrio gazogenes DSM 21264 = NBRC 103151 TaxID=1123492 RepID=A0A1M5FTK8_VIBGA|nr:3'-5' exonuclease [Vibrio gazogenes]USP13533.1 3'-5' exonuclease [Vibrio gazogenes]SHF94880.1 DNA polymerase-3 subunit epsilon [Vibrio gazogenes DSM 21264] [Vibrio gazogenes DSM 21264 = NBRC 103151]SJN54869.1 DNA polymerase III PolC-type [Vibrio gazogenes]
MNRISRRYWYYKLKDSAYRCLFLPPEHQEVVSLDCETTSLNPQQAELVSIAATKIIGNRILTSQSFEVKLCAPRTLNADSVRIHQIRHQDLSDGLTEAEALIQLLDFIGNRPLVGYHIRYDKTILDIACRKHLGFPLPNRLIEVSQLYHEQLERMLPNAYCDLSLEAICRHLDLPLQNKHDALQDALSAALVFVRLTQGDLPTFSSA